MSDNTTETTSQTNEQSDIRVKYVRKFAYVPFRLEGKTIMFGYYYETSEGEKISQRSFLSKRLSGKALLVRPEITPRQHINKYLRRFF